MKTAIIAGWDDVPHLSEKAKADMLKTYPAWQRDARSKGIPRMGAGAIYTVDEDFVKIAPFDIPAHWSRGYAFDPGWRVSAGVFGAHDAESDTVYITNEVYLGREKPPVIAQALRARGATWMKGVIDPAANGRIIDGRAVIQIYKDLGLDLSDNVDNTVDAGILEVWQRLSEGRLRIFSTCTNLLAEYRIYRRDEKGKVVKSNDHALDALRYLVMSGIRYFKRDPGVDPSGDQWWDKLQGGVFCG